jgi:hypothetical protein
MCIKSSFIKGDDPPAGGEGVWIIINNSCKHISRLDNMLPEGEICSPRA